MLALADQNGNVHASVPGLAHTARVEIAECIEALEIFKEPDTFSRTKENEGRRIEEIDGGWHILNHAKYRDIRTVNQIKTAERQQRFRERQKGVTGNASNAPDTDTDTDTETDTEPSSPPTVDFPWLLLSHLEDWRALESRIPAAGLISWKAEMKAALQGMHGPVRTPAEISQAIRDFNGAGADISLRLFRGYLRGNGSGTPENGSDAKPGGKKVYSGGRGGGKTLAAAELKERLLRASGIVPGQGTRSLVSEWDKNFSPEEVRVIKAIGPGRILNDENHGTLLAQLAKALEEV
jgi:hypothetical protein